MSSFLLGVGLISPFIYLAFYSWACLSSHPTTITWTTKIIIHYLSILNTFITNDTIAINIIYSLLICNFCCHLLLLLLLIYRISGKFEVIQSFINIFLIVFVEESSKQKGQQSHNNQDNYNYNPFMMLITKLFDLSYKLLLIFHFITCLSSWVRALIFILFCWMRGGVIYWRAFDLESRLRLFLLLRCLLLQIITLFTGWGITQWIIFKCLLLHVW